VNYAAASCWTLVVCCLLACVAFAAEPAKAPVGWGSGVAARNLTPEARKRIAASPLQDLLDRKDGRYTHMKSDGVGGHWGLDALLARKAAAAKPYDALRDASGVFQTERVIFADTGTGATMMQLTNETAASGGDELNYFGKACWNADGSVMTWQRSIKPQLWGPRGQDTTDTHGPLLANGDGTGLHIAFRKATVLSSPVCSPVDPDVAYANAGQKLVELDLRKGTIKREISTFKQPPWRLKISPDGKYAVSLGYNGGPTKPMYVISLADGKQWEIPLTGAIHDSYRFVPADTEWVMFWYEGKTRSEGMRLVHFRSGEQKTCKMFDWNHGDVGRFIHFHVGGYTNTWDNDRKTWIDEIGRLVWPDLKFDDNAPYYSIPVSVGGYACHWPDDQLWGYALTSSRDPQYLSEISAMSVKPFAEGGRVNRYRVCYANQVQDTSGAKPTTTILSRPNISPDGTKILFNSNPFAPATVYMVQVSTPLAPRNVSAARQGAGVAVKWQAPIYHSEIAGYHVYRSTTSGVGFEQITDAPVSGESFIDKNPAAGAAFYAVRSVEHSGFESDLSAEAAVGTATDTPMTVFCQAEAAIPSTLDSPTPDALWVGFDGLASNLRYIWQRRKDKPGKAALQVTIPRAGAYYVVARLRGQAPAFTIAGQRLTARAVPGKADPSGWQWTTSDQPVTLAAGSQTIEIASDQYGSSLDCFFLATDKDFAGQAATGRIVATVPVQPKLAAAATPNGPRLQWTADKDRRFSHFNVYGSAQAGFTPSQATLVASPDKPALLDWQAPAGKHYYRITQVTRDGLESAPSDEVAVEVK
jgi:hypothetical protein